jgi:hypothetical protein
MAAYPKNNNYLWQYKPVIYTKQKNNPFAKFVVEIHVDSEEEQENLHQTFERLFQHCLVDNKQKEAAIIHELLKALEKPSHPKVHAKEAQGYK